MFNASKGYGAAFDNDIWQPEGMSDAITSDQGLGGFVEDQYKAHKEEMRFAGDALHAYTDTVNAKETADAQVEAAKTRYELMKKNQQGSGGGSFGQIAGVGSQSDPDGGRPVLRHAPQRRRLIDVDDWRGEGQAGRHGSGREAPQRCPRLKRCSSWSRSTSATSRNWILIKRCVLAFQRSKCKHSSRMLSVN